MFNTSKISKKKITWDKRVNILTIDDILLIYFKQVVSFLTQIQTNSSYFVNTYSNSCLISANNTERVIFQVNSWKYYLNPK